MRVQRLMNQSIDVIIFAYSLNSSSYKHILMYVSISFFAISIRNSKGNSHSSLADNI